jgi:hypothetical protein
VVGSSNLRGGNTLRDDVVKHLLTFQTKGEACEYLEAEQKMGTWTLELRCLGLNPASPIPSCCVTLGILLNASWFFFSTCEMEVNHRIYLVGLLE